MSSAARPIFQNGERLTAQRLNEAVDFCLTALRRALLAPLSAGVAIGLELRREIVAGSPSTATLVSAGVAIDGLARVLVLSQEMRFTAADVRSQIADVAPGDVIRVSLGAGRGDRTVLDPCAPVPVCVVERVELFFERVSPLRAEVFPSTVTEVGVVPSVRPWAESLDTAASPAFYAAPLGSVTYADDGTVFVSKADRAPVRPSFGAIRNSYGDMSMRLDRVGDAAAVEMLVPTTFSAPSGGALAQAAVLAANVGAPPAGRPSPADPTVLEAAGGPGAGAVPGTSGVVAISMQYDVTTGQSLWGIARVPESGFPLVLSSGATTAPMVAPLVRDSSQGLIGLSAAGSYVDVNDPAGTRQLVPVATAGLIQAWVNVTAPITVGTSLVPASAPTGGHWGLEVLGGRGGSVVAQTALPLAPTTGPGLQRTWVWAAPPYPFAPVP